MHHSDLELIDSFHHTHNILFIYLVSFLKNWPRYLMEMHAISDISRAIGGPSIHFFHSLSSIYCECERGSALCSVCTVGQR